MWFGCTATQHQFEAQFQPYMHITPQNETIRLLTPFQRCNWILPILHEPHVCNQIWNVSHTTAQSRESNLTIEYIYYIHPHVHTTSTELFIANALHRHWTAMLNMLRHITIVYHLRACSDEASGVNKSNLLNVIELFSRDTCKCYTRFIYLYLEKSTPNWCKE